MTSWGRFLGLMRFLKGCFTSLAIRLASTSSKNSGSTLSVPLIFLRTAFPSSKRPRSMRLLGVSVTIRAPTVRRMAGTPANPSDSLQPHPLVILFLQGKEDIESQKESQNLNSVGKTMTNVSFKDTFAFACDGILQFFH